MTIVPVLRLSTISVNGKLTLTFQRFDEITETHVDFFFGDIQSIVPLAIRVRLPNLSPDTGMHWFSNQVVVLRHSPGNLRPLDSGE